MKSPYQFWIDLGQLLLSPNKLLFGWFELFFSWLYSRNWMTLLFGLPLICLATLMLGSSLYINWLGPRELLQHYWKAVEEENQFSTLLRTEKAQELKDKETEIQQDPESTDLMSQEKLTPYASSLLQKIIQLERSDNRANYLVAAVLSNQGRTAQSRQLMRRIAPENERGFAPAHAWLAADRLQSLSVKDQRELVVLMSDLAEAKRWPGVEPMLMSAYADLLIREKRIDEAISVLRAAGQKDSRLLVKLAGIAKQQENQPLFKNLRQELEAPRQERVQNGSASEWDFIELASIYILDKEVDKAVEIMEAGQRKYANSPQLKRLLSSAYMMSFDEVSINDSDSPMQWEILELAMKSDPSNPQVLEKIADLTAKGKVNDERIAAYLREQLAAGKATAITHLLLAIGHLKKNELDKALVHLEVAQGLAPTNPIILNNLALCIARTRPDELPKARKMLEVAISVAGANPELLDSYGEILLLSKDYVGAIRALEAVLSVNQDRSSTRKKLSEAYTLAGLDDMAESVKKAGLQKEESVKEQGSTKSDEILRQDEAKAENAK